MMCRRDARKSEKIAFVQLVREDNSALGKTYTYTYDNAGNILFKRTYPLTAEGVTPTGTPTTVTYGYGDADWGDKLTSLNGVTLTYDAVGNPLTYYNGISDYDFTWTAGSLRLRKLTTMSCPIPTMTTE